MATRLDTTSARQSSSRHAFRAAQRETRLRLAVPPLLCGSACRVTLDKEKFAFLRVAVRAVCKLSRHAAAAHEALALNHFTSLSGSGSCSCREDNLFNDQLALSRMLLEVCLESCRSGLRDSRSNFRISKLRLGLALELRLRDLDGYDGRKTFAEIFRSDVALELVQKLVLFSILLERAAQAHLEAKKVGSALYGVDVVDVGINLL